jgi:hypothetical protein
VLTGPVGDTTETSIPALRQSAFCQYFRAPAPRAPTPDDQGTG